MPYVAERAPVGWKIRHENQMGTSDPGDFETFENTDFSDDSPDTRAYEKAWARLLSKVYEIDPMVCPKCGSEMKVIALIQETEEIKRILRYLVKQRRPMPGFDQASLKDFEDWHGGAVRYRATISADFGRKVPIFPLTPRITFPIIC